MKRSKPRRLMICALGVVLAWATPALAQTPPGQSDEAKARKLFNEGLELYELGRYKEACAKLEASLLAFPGTGTRGKLAECYEKRGMLASAHKLYREVERLAREKGDKRAAIAAERAEALEARVPRLVIEPGPSATLRGFRVALDGKNLEVSSLGIAIFVDPGNHAVAVSAPGHETWKTSVSSVLAKTSTVRIPGLRPAPADRSAERAPSRGQRIAGWSLLGLAAAGVAVGSTSGILAWQTSSDRDECLGPNKIESPQCEELYDEANLQSTIANISFATAAAAAIVGVVLIWRNRGGDRADREQAVQLVPVVTEKSAAVQVMYRF